MYIVGTSGHIDHGKTSLIKALTGIDCDRLPEEKEREMTIDIGFAQIEYPGFGAVSIIDVPGHERFIRNMAAGVWGIDLALLVIAVDDGWMPQTEDHFRIIDLLGIERIIVVLSKIDIADEETTEIAEEEVKERLRDTRFKNPDIVRVSSKTGFGLEELKKKILQNLEKLSGAVNAGKPYLFVDRVFESKGHGTIITGTLRNGSFFEDEEITILPGNRKARIKKIESHHQTSGEGYPAQRTALNLHGVAVEELTRGHIIVKNNFFTGSADIIANIKLLDVNKEIKNNLGIEILIGTSDIKGRLILLNNNEKHANEFPVRIKFDSRWFFFPAEPFIITNPGGYRIIGGGKVILPDYSTVKDKKLLRKSINLLKNYSIKEITGFIINIKQAIKIDMIKSLLANSNESIEKTILELLKDGSIIQIDDYIADKIYYADTKKRVAAIIKKKAGLNIKEIADIVGIEPDTARILIHDVRNDNPVIEKDGKYFSGDSVTIDSLADDKKRILHDLKEKDAEGIALDKVTDNSVKKNLKELIRLGFAISLDGNIIYHFEIYDELKKKVIGLFNSRDRISISDAKEATELSRKYLIPLLNRIESDGIIKRLGEFRVKV